MTAAPPLTRGSPVRIHSPGHHRHGQTGYIASLDVQDEGEPHHRVAVGGVFVALPADVLVPVPADVPIWPKPGRRA